MKEVAAILGKVIGRAGLQYVQLPEDAARKAMVQFGLTRDLTDLLLEMVDAMSRGHMKALEPRSARNTTPTSYESFCHGRVSATLSARRNFGRMNGGPRESWAA